MGIYGALATAVSGLRAQAFALENISGNIANSQTTGYKRIETSFVDLIPDAPLKRQVPGAVVANSRATNTDGGDVVAAANETYMALNGSGFFVVEQKVGQADGGAVFGGTDYFTRRGDFDFDKDGYLVNGAGYYLKGFAIDPNTGNMAGSVPEVIRLSNAFLPAKATTAIEYALNLPELPKPQAYSANTPGSELMIAADYANDPAADGFVQGADGDLFLSQSIAGGAITIFSENGSPVNVQMRWAKTSSVENGGVDEWQLFYLTDSSATGTDPMWRSAGVDYTFAGDGTLDPAVSSTTLTNLTVNGVNVGDITLRHGTNGVTQFGDANGQTTVTALDQNGFRAGEFVSVAVNGSGRMVASYSNGQQIEVAAVAVAQFNAPNALKRLDGGIFASTSESGTAVLGTDANVIGSALESSNTDISEEFTKLIVTQQAYAANTRIVSSADEMLREALNMVR